MITFIQFPLHEVCGSEPAAEVSASYQGTSGQGELGPIVTANLFCHNYHAGLY